MAAGDTKACATCGRTIEWRTKWAKTWRDVRYCGEQCRRSKPSAADRALEAQLLRALQQAPRNRDIDPLHVCVSQNAPLSADERERVLRAARRLVASGHAEIVQHRRVADASTVKWPWTLRPA